MDEADGKEDDAPDQDQDDKVRLLQAQSLERRSAATRLNCAGLTFTCALKCVFVVALLLSVLSNILLGQVFGRRLPNGDLQKSSVTSNLMAYFTLAPLNTGWKTNALIATFVAVICVGMYLAKLKKTTDLASRRKEEVPTISASIQQV